MERKKTKIAIIGAGGYSGGELVSILVRHPRADIVGLSGSGRSDKPQNIADLFPRLRGRIDMPVGAADLNAIRESGAEAVFLATPHEASIHWASDLLSLGANAPKVFDLSGAFRLKSAAYYPRFYGFEHEKPDLLRQAVYGLPELHRKELLKADLIAVPGCYPTSAILPLAPLAKAGAIDRKRRVIVDSTSGVSGAGRSPAVKSLFCEVSLQPYKVFKHRHNPEIDLYSGTPVVFTPHLGQFDRGILSTIHIELAERWDGPRVSSTLHAAYDNEPFVRLMAPDTWPSVAAVRGTNFCDIAWAVDEVNKHLIIVSAIDNLVKGAAGQAVQCFNICFGFEEGLAVDGGGSLA
jgi:N-acetyl-gamma-glutamyl-phosphate reductase